MFAQAAATVPLPVERVTEALMTADRPWSITLDGDGNRLLAKVGVKVGNLELYKHVQLRIGRMQPVRHEDRLMLPVSWQAVGGPPIFPRMEGELIVEPWGDHTRLTLHANYDPPMGKLGEAIDRAVMHRLAESTMTDFVDRVAAAVSERA